VEVELEMLLKMDIMLVFTVIFAGGALYNISIILDITNMP
jgi:hypothetical protein